MPPTTQSAGFNPAGQNNPTLLAKRGVFRREGEYWTLGLGDEVIRLKHAKGLAYLAHLLRHPVAEFHVLDLAGGIAGQSEDDETWSTRGLPGRGQDLEKTGIQIARLGDAGEMLDEQARTTYRRRLSELREELEEAKEQGKIKRAEQVEEEIDAISRELSRAVGLGGRDRRAASASERARQSVTKSIKAVVDRIAQGNPMLGDFLGRCIRTGNFCSYQPDPVLQIAWEVAVASRGLPGPPMPAGEPSPAGPEYPPSSPAMLGVPAYTATDRTAFVGRESEGDAVRPIIHRALKGHGGLVMLGGGPGVGKTRFAIEMAEYASRHGLGCLMGRCYERDEPFPFLPFVEIIEGGLAQARSQEYFRRQIGDNAAELAQLAPGLRRVFPDIPPPLELPAPQKRLYLFQSLLESLARAARTNPLFLILDDLQWADESTLALLTYLSGRVASLPLVIIGTYRDQYTNAALARTLEELIRMGIRPLKLGGLSKESVAKMLNGLSQRDAPDNLVSAIFEESNGNPFFVEEVYRHLVEDGRIFDSAGQFRADLEIDEIDVPENVRLIIGRRLNHFNENEKHVLSVAAVIGRSFSFRLLAAVSQLDVDELFTVVDKAQEMGIIVSSSEGPETPFTFAHELVRQTLLANILTARRQHLHVSLADAIERLYPDAVNDHVAEIADHLLKAGSFADSQKLVRWLTLAGNRALEMAAFDEARANFISALSRIAQSDSRTRAELFTTLGIAERGLGRWDDAHRHMDEALGIFTTLEDGEAIGRICLTIAQGYSWIGRWREATQIAERGLTWVSDAITPDRVFLLVNLGISKGVEGDAAGADKAFKAALALAEQLGVGDIKGTILALRCGFDFFFVRLHQAIEDSRQAADLLTPASGPWPHVQRLFGVQAALYHLGRRQEADEVGPELVRLATKIGQVAALSYCRRLEALADFGREPELVALEDRLRKDLEANKDAKLDVFVAWSHAQLSMVEFFRGNWDKALEYAGEACRLQADDVTLAINIGTLFRHRAYMGDREGALGLFKQRSEMLPRPGQANNNGSWAMLLLIVEGLMILGERDQAAAFYPLLRELLATGAVNFIFIWRFTETIAGLAAAAAGQWEFAEDHFRTALQQAQSFPDQREQADILRFHAMMLVDRGEPADRDKARTMLGEALQIYAAVGMPRHIELTRSLYNQAAG